jgi:hypothetical protein
MLFFKIFFYKCATKKGEKEKRGGGSITHKNFPSILLSKEKGNEPYLRPFKEE